MSKEQLAGLVEEMRRTPETSDAVLLAILIGKYTQRLSAILATLPEPGVVSDESVRVGNLPTMNQDGYPGLGEWWVQLWRGDEIIARVYGDGPDEVRSQAQDIADALNQQPAAVDGDSPCPAPRNRQEAAALARLALAYLGVTRAHIDAVIARCETDLAAQQGGRSDD